MLTALCTAALLGACPTAWGQEKAKKDEKKPKDVTLETSDGFEIQATFYPGTKGKETVPVVLLHMYKGSRGDYKDLALYLQSLGHAVLVPDLRGHGDSLRAKNGGPPLNVGAINRAYLVAMVWQDMEAVENYLLARNNDGELNIEKLCVVGSEMGATVALNWAVYNWHWPVLLGRKQGQDVKALVLISPEFGFRGATLKEALANQTVRSELSIMILVGKNKPKALQEAERIYGFFKPYHPDPPANLQAQNQDLFFGRMDTELQGTKMLGVKSLGVEKLVAKFIELRLVSKTFPWRQR